MAARRDRNYGKEIIGTLMWVLLMLYLFRGGGIPGCQKDKASRPNPPSSVEDKKNAGPGER